MQTELQEELDALEQEALDERLTGADHVPLHKPELAACQYIHRSIYGRGILTRTFAAPSRTPVAVEDDEDEQLRKLQLEMAM